MFAITCPTIDSRVLIWPSSIRHVTNTTKGIAVTFTCACRAPGVMVTGRHATSPGSLVHHGHAAAPDRVVRSG